MDAPSSKPVDDLLSAAGELDALLARLDETSLRVEIGDALNKAYLLAAASYLESVVIHTLQAFVQRVGDENEALGAFVANQALKRKYHTLFNWDVPNANQFFGLFGKGALTRYRERMANDSEAPQTTAAFLELGQLRNQVAHGNFAVFPLAKTRNELQQLFLDAVKFPRLIDEIIDSS